MPGYNYLKHTVTDFRDGTVEVVLGRKYGEVGNFTIENRSHSCGHE